MAEGTRLRELDTRLSTHESKLSEFLEGLTKTRAEVTQQVTEVGVKMDKRLDAVGVRIDKLNKNFLEIKQLLLGMQSHHKPPEPGSLVDTSIGSSAMFITHPSDLHTGTFIPPSSSMITPSVTLTPPTNAFTIPPLSTHSMHILIPTQAPFMGASNIYTTPPSPHGQIYNTFTNSTISHTIPHHIFPPPFNSFTYQPNPPPHSNSFATANPHSIPNYHNFHVNPKIEFSKFDGTDPKRWVIKSEQYFEFILVEDSRKMKLAGLHFEGRASIWFRFYQASKGLVAWKLFKVDVIAKFENPEGKDVQELFNKLKQTSLVAEYEDKFEELRAMVLHKNKGFTEEYFVSSF